MFPGNRKQMPKTGANGVQASNGRLGAVALWQVRRDEGLDGYFIDYEWLIGLTPHPVAKVFGSLQI